MSSYLKSSHVSRIACILQTILVTLEEELKEKPATNKTETLLDTEFKKMD